MKKILIINNQPMDALNNSGITIKSIFNNYPKEKLFEISLANSSIGSKSLKERSYVLSKKYHPCYYLMNLNTFEHVNTYTKKTGQQNSRQSIIKSKIKKILISYFDYSLLFPPFEIIAALDDFKPDYIYTLSGSIISLKTATYFAKRYDIKIVPHFMDNWIDTLYKDSKLQFLCRKKLLKLVENMYKYVDNGLVISEKMAREYTQRFKKNHYPLMHTIEKHIDFNDKDIVEKNHYKIVYAGGLHLNRWSTVLKICNVLDCINENTNLSFSLDIYTSAENRNLYEYLFDNTCAMFHDFVQPEQLLEIYYNSDYLLHIESFDQNVQEFIRLSLSTKIPEYMSTGKNIILCAPKDTAVFQYIDNNKVGFAFDSGEVNWKQFLNTIIDIDKRKEYSKNAIKLAKEKHSEVYKNSILEKVFK